MVNVGDLFENNKFKIKNLEKLVNKNNSKKIKFIRLACHHNEIFYLQKSIKYLRSLNLKIFVNAMQITELNFKKI